MPRPISADRSAKSPTQSPANRLPDLSHDALQVARASALLWGPRTRTDFMNLLAKQNVKDDQGRRFTGDVVKAALDELRRKEQLQEDPRRPGYLQLTDPLRIALYRQQLDEAPPGHLAALLASFEHVNLDEPRGYWASLSHPAAVSLLRVALLSGESQDRIERIKQMIDRQQGSGRVFGEAVMAPFDAQTFGRIVPAWRWGIALSACVGVGEHWNEAYRPIVDWCFERIAEDPTALTPQVREALSAIALQRGDLVLARRCVDGIDDGLADALRAAMLVFESRWADGQAAFEAAIKRRQAEISARKRVLPESVAWLYPLALLARGTPQHLELARKFCIGEAGKREPHPLDPWGRWVNAIDARLGKAPLVAEAFSLDLPDYEPLSLHHVWQVLLAAWLGSDQIAQGARAAPKRKAGNLENLLDALREPLHEHGFAALLKLLDGARQVLDGGEPAAGFFVSGRGEAWRDVLVALQSLGGESAGRETRTETTSRLLWSIEIGKRGELLGIVPLEQKRSTRGWSTPKPMTLARIAKHPGLSPPDARVARCLRAERGYTSRFDLDLAAAIGALVGHPAVVLAGAPERTVELVESPPELEVLRQGDRYVMRVHPAPRPASDAEAFYYDARDRRDAEALRLITLQPDGAQRIRLIRFTAAQLRAAQLVSGRFAVPAAADAQAELQKALHALTGHFQVHADAAQASRQVAAEARLRALLSPVGEALNLRLVVAPLGDSGPRLVPGRGRSRLLAPIDAETVGTERDLDAERVHLDAVLGAFPWLEEIEDGEPNDGCEWTIADPELALGLVETLPTLTAIAAVEWPKGKKVRVLTVDTGRLGVQISRDRDWFRVSGQAGLDDGLVVQLETLLAAATGNSRFIPIGDGIYAALTRSLRQKLVDLAAVVESEKAGAGAGLKVPPLAAAWLDDLLDGTSVDAGKEFRQAIDRLRAAQKSTSRLPRTLQAELRPYQEDGYLWAMRLAEAGLGGCLADDMGLGKTLQALAVLLQRAAGGAALVVAPTSVCGNWLAETLRFAPSLNARIYSEADEVGREALVADAGPRDVLIVSYTLLQLAQERFAARQWHTLVADEAQAVKNAATKRSQALFELNADFRLALSGTPVENRLAELWSIMRFANPGLLGSIGRFNERFAAPIERNRDREAQHVLKRLIGPFVLRRTKAHVLHDLPPRTELVLSITAEPAEAAHYEALRRQAMREVAQLGDAPAGQARFNILAQLTRLRRAACDPRLASPDLGITGAKVQAFAELAAELSANGHKTLVFSQFVDFLQLLRAPLDAAGLHYQYLDGATPAAERSRRVAAFQAGDGDFFLISLKAGGFGLNLTAADYVVITDPWWNPAAEDQAMGRAHRIGQQRPVTVYRLVGKGTIEERIVDLHHDKRALAESILDDGDAAALPSTEDLVALIRGE